MSAALSANPGEWYRELEKPWFNPPAWIFGPVWTMLYAAMGVAAWMVWRSSDEKNGTNRNVALILFAVQLVLNAIWTPLFFGMQRPDFALMDIVLLWAAIAATMAQYWRVSRGAAVLMLPYWAWVSFAAILNGAIWWLN